MEPPAQIKRGIRWKLLVGMIGLIVALLAVLSGIEIVSSHRLIEREVGLRIGLMRDVLVARGEGAASQLAKEIGNHLAGFAFSAVSEVVTNATRLNPQLAYGIVLNTNAQALVHAGQHGALIHFNGELKQYIGEDDRFAARQAAAVARNVLVDGTEVLEVIAPILVGNERWGVLRLGFSLAELRSEIENSRREMRGQIQSVITRSGLTAGGVVLLGMVVVAWLSALISKPLQRVTESARQLATGDFSAAQRLDIRSQDEVGVLADAFTTMAANLQKTYAQLEDYSRTLELTTRCGWVCNRSFQVGWPYAISRPRKLTHTKANKRRARRPTQPAGLSLDHLHGRLRAEIHFGRNDSTSGVRARATSEANQAASAPAMISRV